MKITFNNFLNLGKYSSLSLRIGLGILLLLFGMDELRNPENWLGFIPPWLSNLLPFSASTFLKINASVEIIFGALLLLGMFTRIVAFLAALHMLGIVVSVGYNDIGIRDFAIFCAALALFFSESYYFSLDNKFFSNKTET